jgi:hypothetical protein
MSCAVSWLINAWYRPGRRHIDGSIDNYLLLQLGRTTQYLCVVLSLWVVIMLKKSSKWTQEKDVSDINAKFTQYLTLIGPCILIYFCSKSNQMHQLLKFILFWNNNLHVSEGLSVHHQEIKTVYTATCYCMYSHDFLMMDGKTVWNMWSVIPKENKFEKLVHLVGFIIEIIHYSNYMHSSVHFYGNDRISIA